MKQRSIKQALSVIMASLLLAGTAACGAPAETTDDGGAAPTETTETTDANQTDTSDTAQTETTDEGQAEPAEAAASGPLDPFPETVNVSWGISSTSMQDFFDGDTYDNNRWSRKILEDLNIQLEVAFTADGSTTAYQDKMRTLLVSGDLPDIMSTYDRVFFNDAVEAGYLTDLGPLVDQYALESVKEYQVKYPDTFEGGKIDGKLYGFPAGMNDNFHTGNYLWIRDDWLENTGSQPPTTVDEFVELARKFTFNDPNGDGSKTWGFAMTNRYVADSMVGLLSAHGVPSITDDGLYYRRDGENLTYSLIQPEVKNVLEILRGMYNEGIIDPEFIVKDMSTLEADIANNTVGMFDFRNWGTWYPFHIVWESQEVITRPYPMPKMDGTDYKVGVSNNSGGQLLMLNSACEYPEAFVKILNLWTATVLDSTDSEGFNYYDTNNQGNLIPVKIGIPSELNAPAVHEAIEMGSGDHLPAAVRPYYDYVLNFESGTDKSAPAYGTWGQMFERGSMAIALYDYREDGAMVENVLGAEVPEAYLENNEILRNIRETAFTEIITGSKELDDFDTFVADWLNNGGQQILDQLEELYPAE